MTGQELRALRGRHQLTAEALAKQLGVSRATLYRYEAAEKLPTIVTTAVHMLAYLLDKAARKREEG